MHASKTSVIQCQKAPSLSTGLCFQHEAGFITLSTYPFVSKQLNHRSGHSLNQTVEPD